MIEALYIHIPFCVQRCAYCDFATRAENDGATMDAYVERLGMQLRRAARAGLLGGVRTIYIGGGTPTHLGSRRLVGLVYLVSLSVMLENVVEFTVECNPESLDAALVCDLFALGVNRFSIGAQSFDGAVLAEYGRVHDAAATVAAVQAVRARCDNFSLDLICGGPGQSMQSWEGSVRSAIELGAKHVSIYPLTIEEGTPLARRIEAGECAAPSDDVEADMMLAAERMLCAAGFERYEVASYAKPGFESRHNTAYWTGVEYLGLGAAASSMFSPDSWSACLTAGVFEDAAQLQCSPYQGELPGRVRPNSQCSPYQGELSPEWATEGVKTRSFDSGRFAPFAQDDAGGDAVEQSAPAPSAPPNEGELPGRVRPNSQCSPYQGELSPEWATEGVTASTTDPACARVRYTAAFGDTPGVLETLTAREAALEDVMLGFRRSVGVTKAQLAQATRLVPELPATIERVCELGLAAKRGDRVVPTQRGWLCGNELYGAIWGLA